MSSLEKHKSILDFTLSSIWRRKGKNTSLLLVYSFIIFLLASVVFFVNSIKLEAQLVLRDTPELLVQKLVAGRHELIPVHYMKPIEEIRGVQSVKARLWGYYFDATNGANYTLMVSEDYRERAGEVAIGSGVARNLLAREHGTLPFKTYEGAYVFMKIREVLTLDSELLSADLVLMSEKDFRTIFKLPEGVATDLLVHARNERELPTIATKITQIFPDTRPILRDEILRTYDAVFDWRGGLVIVVLCGAIFAFIILAWDKATGLSAEERREIGVLKALGWETSDVLMMKFWEGAAVSVSSFFLGVYLAYLHVFHTAFFLFEPVLKGWSVIFPKFELTPFVNPYHLFTLFFLTVLPYTVTTIIPSWRASTIDPDAVMRA